MAKKNLLILLPVYNDWRSLSKLLFMLDTKLDSKKFIINILVVDDASSKVKKMNNHNFKNINNIKVLRLENNSGNQKAIFLGLKYIYKLKYKGIIAVMDADGEDDPTKLELLINKLIEKKNNFIVAARSKRTENLMLKLLNFFRLILTFLFTGKFINFGNYSCFYSHNLKKIIDDKSKFFAYCATLQKYKITKIYIDKKKRYFDKSKINLSFLINHSINIILVFFRQFLFRSILLIFFSLKMQKYLMIFNYLTVILVFINIIVIFMYLKKTL